MSVYPEHPETQPHPEDTVENNLEALKDQIEYFVTKGYSAHGLVEFMNRDFGSIAEFQAAPFGAQGEYVDITFRGYDENDEEITTGEYRLTFQRTVNLIVTEW